MPINYLDIEKGVIGYTQENYTLKRHAHFPIEVVFALSGQIEIATDDGQCTPVQSAIIPSNTPHTFICLEGTCQLYFFDPTALAGQQLLAHYPMTDREPAFLDDLPLEHFVAKHVLFPEQQPQGDACFDPRIQQCLDWINQHFETEAVDMRLLSRKIFLSPSRLAHLFKTQIGISIHQYVLWKKIELAMLRFMAGDSLIDCAYASGFTDASHLNKTFKKMFGIHPSFENRK